VIEVIDYTLMAWHPSAESINPTSTRSSHVQSTGEHLIEDIGEAPEGETLDGETPHDETPHDEIPLDEAGTGRVDFRRRYGTYAVPVRHQPIRRTPKADTRGIGDTWGEGNAVVVAVRTTPTSLV
jgi:hypothetical protein